MRSSGLYMLALISGSLVSSPLSAVERSKATVQETLVDSRPCFFFILNGVSEADPAIPNGPWFAIPTSASNYQVMAATVMSAKLSGSSLHVLTDGTKSCGWATASTVGAQ